MGQAQKHPIYWFDDGFLILEVQDVQFRVHHSHFQCHSSILALAEPFIPSCTTNSIANCTSQVIFCEIDRGFRSRDVEALLEHLYDDIPLSSDSSFQRILAVLRSTGPQQFDMPTVHVHAKNMLVLYFNSMDPSKIPKVNLFEAVAVARKFRILSVLKIALYHSMVAVDFDLGDDVAEDPRMTSQSAVLSESPSTSGIEKGSQLTECDVRLCKSLMTRVIDHFTPILFTPATTPHMGCTDVFADTWMTCVISPAIETGGVYRPIETLERIRDLDWVKHGLCSACVEEKDKEWREEQENVWNMIERWLEMEIIRRVA